MESQIYDITHNKKNMHVGLFKKSTTPHTGKKLLKKLKQDHHHHQEKRDGYNTQTSTKGIFFNQSSCGRLNFSTF